MGGKYFWQNRKFDGVLKNTTDGTINEDAMGFVSSMMAENLNHARHIESERLTYCACITALVAGYLAFFASRNSAYTETDVFFCLLVSVATAFSFRLNERWSYSFNRHMEYAKGCYLLMYRAFINVEDKYVSDRLPSSMDELKHYFVMDSNSENRADTFAFKENFRLKGIKENIPYQMYAFDINSTVLSKVCVDKISTKYYFRLYYVALYFVMLLAMANIVQAVNVVWLSCIVWCISGAVTFAIFVRPFYFWCVQKIFGNKWKKASNVISAILTIPAIAGMVLWYLLG